MRIFAHMLAAFATEDCFMTHLERLECATDGRIPREARMAALAKDLAERRAGSGKVGRQMRVRLRVKAQSLAGQIDAMARCLVRLREERGCATRMDLVEHGFRLDVVDAHGNAAVARAGQIWLGKLERTSRSTTR